MVQKIVKKERIDILMLQEAGSRNSLVGLTQQLNTQKLFGGRWQDAYLQVNRGLAFIWNAKKVSNIYADKWDDYTALDSKLFRSPFVGGFIVADGKMSLWLVNLHIKYADARNESIELERIYSFVESAVKRMRPVGYTLLAGDFNRSASQIISPNAFFHCYQNQKTTLNHQWTGYSSDYDHFCYGDRLKPFVENISVIFAPGKYYKKDFKRYYDEISDHVPIIITIAID
jgi:endonuclease/exonuclease/phosphatase family metal-dependent hydrolase